MQDIIISGCNNKQDKVKQSLQSLGFLHKDNDLSELANLQLVRDNLSVYSKEDIDNIIKNLKDSTLWRTRGYIQTTVGFLEDNSQIPNVMNLQAVMDSIFYGEDYISFTVRNKNPFNDQFSCILGEELELDIDISNITNSDKIIIRNSSGIIKEIEVQDEVKLYSFNYTFNNSPDTLVSEVYYKDELKASKTITLSTSLITYSGIINYSTYNSDDFSWETYLPKLADQYLIFKEQQTYTIDFKYSGVASYLYIAIPVRDTKGTYFSGLQKISYNGSDYTVDMFEDPIEFTLQDGDNIITYLAYVYKYTLCCLSNPVEITFSYGN